ncbi:MAG TPA: hypothetical protein VKV20_07745 [Ktedonobacteraceae bacterium]|jgi:hypothetical protein|nr:hypothetical protein [Ktedonobacteraceae bacterium]
MNIPNSTKVFIVVLFLIGILFIVGINIGAAHSDDTAFSTPGWVNSLGGTLARTQPLKLSDLSPVAGNCLQQGTFVILPGNTCTFGISQSSFTSRVVTLQLVQGTPALVTLTQEQSLTVQETLSSSKVMTDANMKVYPGKAHGMLAIQCLGASGGPACMLQLK